MNLPSQDVKDILAAAISLGLTFKVNLYIGMEPALPQNCVTIYDTPGMEPTSTLNKGEDIYRPSIQIKVRNVSYEAAGVLINNIKAVLHNLSHEVWNGTVYELIKCAQEPFCLGFDVNNLCQWVCNFEINRY